MNKTVPSPKNWPDSKNGARLVMKKSGIRAIDKGTSYDVPGKLRRLAHEIKKGFHGEVRGAIVGILTQADGGMRANYISCGLCSISELNMLANYLVEETGIR